MSSAQILSVKYNENNVPYIGLGEHELRLESEPPKEAVLEKARTELRELPEIVGPAVAELREMLKSKCSGIAVNEDWLKTKVDERWKIFQTPNKQTKIPIKAVQIYTKNVVKTKSDKRTTHMPNIALYTIDRNP